MSRKIGLPAGRQGFTLMELLTVVGIIGVLLAMVTVSYSIAQKRSRDTKRRGDIKAMQDALEQHYSNNATSPFSYPGTCSTASTYMRTSWPSDPINAVSGGVSYVYTQLCDSDSYYICARLESGNGNSSADAIDSNGTGFSYTEATGNNYYCLNNLQ